ncbi:MAG: hypothetical protein M1818_004834 [Claussenomyces sp. TS43310]|nr:MAG: hypothetical protein M1818_004834 [Claussenomyces sp. TS43310]
MTNEKPQLRLALYARMKDPQTYHYALHISSKNRASDPLILDTTKFHCKNIIQSIDGSIKIPWIYEVTRVNPEHDRQILVAVVLGELRDADLAARLFAEVPVIQDDPNFNCVIWVQRALSEVYQAKILLTTPIFDWDKIQKTALQYVTTKKQQGRFMSDWRGDSSRVPTFDMVLGQETVP